MSAFHCDLKMIHAKDMGTTEDVLNLCVKHDDNSFETPSYLYNIIDCEIPKGVKYANNYRDAICDTPCCTLEDAVRDVNELIEKTKKDKPSYELYTSCSRIEKVLRQIGVNCRRSVSLSGTHYSLYINYAPKIYLKICGDFGIPADILYKMIYLQHGDLNDSPKQTAYQMMWIARELRQRSATLTPVNIPRCELALRALSFSLCYMSYELYNYGTFHAGEEVDSVKYLAVKSTAWFRGLKDLCCVIKPKDGDFEKIKTQVTSEVRWRGEAIAYQNEDEVIFDNIKLAAAAREYFDLFNNGIKEPETIREGG